MFKVLLKQEIQSLLKSNRVVWSLLVFIVMFALVFWIRVDDFKQQRQSYIADQQMFADYDKDMPIYSYIHAQAIFPPVLFTIYHEGGFLRMGHLVDSPLFEVLDSTTEGNSAAQRFFRDTVKLDITTLIIFFLSLFILLITFDSVNGEKKDGTLRLLMTFELKRCHFLLKKIVGTFLFVNMVIFIPFFISLIILLVMFPSLITVGFMQQWILYLIAISIFSTCFILLGIWTSLLTKSPGKSLVYAIFCWIALLMILPMTMPLLTGKFKHDNSFDKYQKEFEMVWNQKAEKWLEVDRDNNLHNGGHLQWNNIIDQTTVLSTVEVENVHVNYIRDTYKKVFPLNKRLSELRILRDKAEDDNYIFSDQLQFYNPRICLMRIAENISGCSMSDYGTFLTDANQIRDKIVSQGIRDKWLISRQFFAIVDTSFTMRDVRTVKSRTDLIKQMDLHRFKFTIPNLPKYEYKESSLMTMVRSSYIYFCFLLLFILGLFLWDLNLFKKYDIR